MKEERKYWDEQIETMPLDKLRQLQEERLQALVARAYEKTALYRRKFDQLGIKPHDIETIEDLRELPLTEYMEDFCRTPLLEKMAVPWDEISVFGSTSGTVSGFTQPVPFTKRDLEIMLDQQARSYWAMGVRPWDTVMVTSGVDSIRRGFGQLGARFLFDETGRRNLDYQIKLADIMGVTIIQQLPSLMLRFLERARELGSEARNTKLRMIAGIGESWAETYKKKVEEEYGVAFRTAYASYESGMLSSQCGHGEGMHYWNDYFIIEILDLETKKPLGIGEEGEVVVTPLMLEAVPLIRYRTGDVAHLLPYEPCSCNRTQPKISMVKGRVTEITRVAGKNIMPIDIEEIIASIPQLGDQYQIIVDRPGELERLKVKVEHRPEAKDIGALKNQVEEAIYRDLGIESEVEIIDVGGIERALFKAQRLITTYK